MDRENREVTALVEAGGQAPTDQKPATGYWKRVSRAYKAAFSLLCLVLAVFLVVFSVLSARAFTYDGLFYFGKDLSTLISLSNRESGVIYYDYEGVGARPQVYRGGVAVAHSGGVDIYAASGELLLALEDGHNYATPRVAVSRDYLAVYDFGGNAFSVCNSYAKLYEGKCDYPIYGVHVSDAGYITLITGSNPTPAANEPFYLSEVLVFDAHFNLVQHFGRATATISAAVSPNGRTVTLVGAGATGTVVDVYTVGREAPLSATALPGFPLAAGYTATGKLAVLTDTACHTLSTTGKLYETVDYNGATLAAYSIDENGVSLALEVDRLHTQYRALVLNKKGSVRSELTVAHPVSAVALSGKYLWVLGGKTLSCFAKRDGKCVETRTLDEGALGASVLGDRTVRVLFPAQALDVTVTG